MHYATIDLGSNTFHLLIVEVVSGKFIEKYRKRSFVGLGDGGIAVLKESSIQRGLECCKEFAQILASYQNAKLVITGTAALRAASNAHDFISQAETIFDQKIQIIDGDLEAKYIFNGVKLLSSMHECSLIIDIGGGSTEFIIAEHGEMLWAQSYTLGVGVLHSLFHKEEPISRINEEGCRSHIKKTIQPLLAQLSNHRIHTLIGASGSFEVLESMSGRMTFAHEINVIPKDDVKPIIKRIIAANYNEREKMEGLPKERVKLIVVGMILIDELMNIVEPERVIVTPYALKEGVLAELVK
jgi:exopolyphosphatase / guanosine-5'-triphosphate,3'-diphosphate pyrophosphatase